MVLLVFPSFHNSSCPLLIASNMNSNRQKKTIAQGKNETDINVDGKSWT